MYMNAGFLSKITSKLKGIFRGKYDFNKSNPLGGDGERVDIEIKGGVLSRKPDMYQKSHLKRYEFARDLINENDVCGDFACGTGYGSVILSAKASEVIGADINEKVVAEIKIRYKDNIKVRFLYADVLTLDYQDYFDNIISFETLEHLEEENLKKALKIFNKALKPKGQLFFSTPYMQEKSENAIKLGFHLTFFINEEKIRGWLKDAGFAIKILKYQNYDTHLIKDNLKKKDFIICVAEKI
jgi:2-polyprenyl-3-methyl-5-hydroxy-6-metoxy-1,4-benzoquinol methylase